MSQQIQNIPFHGDTIEAVMSEGKWFASLRRMCENLGVAYAAQYVKLKEKPWATISIIETVGADGKSREMTMIDRRTMTMWLAGINASKVREDLRPKIEAYQCEAADVLDRYFNEDATSIMVKALMTPAAVAKLLTAYDNQMKENARLVVRNAELEPKAKALDDFTETGEAMTLRDAASLLCNMGCEIKESELRQWMLSHNWIYRKGKAYKAYHDRLAAKHLKYSHSQRLGQHRDGTMFEFEPTVYVTRRGLTLLHQRLSTERLNLTLDEANRVKPGDFQPMLLSPNTVNPIA
ncbi:phage antirepressor N-terminal domain-containing protein [Bifidobacterium olomucense]|uniref:Antirepressor n=1 Tax=Bifidobacterium olomucense TaxID=2675324 RepID=A0A7Y0HXA2_9BIFI|nr:phage antirepressor N-terminal domain-containing protein [Bifidobacterium sp. DSM 109959]NMM98117.1 antirepressor [Bifidobacterium sp. DSM 109959]